MRGLRRIFTADVLVAVGLLVLAVAAWMHIASLSARAAMFPRLTIGLLFVLALAYLGREILSRAPVAPREALFHHRVRFFVALGLIIAYAAVFPRVGFLTTTFVFIPVFAAAIGMRRHLLTIAGSAIFTGATYVVFVVLLRRRLPPELLVDLLQGL